MTFAACGSPSEPNGVEPDASVVVGDDAQPDSDTGLHNLAVVTNGRTACAIRNGALYCWGDNFFGEVVAPAGGQMLVPTQIAGIADAIAVETGLSVTCVARASGTTECWGNALTGHVVVPGLDHAVDIHAVDRGFCALQENGEVRCWGDTYFGDGTSAPHNDARPATLPEPIVQLDGTYATYCARTASGNVYCWGVGYVGTPTRVMDLEPAAEIAAGGYYDGNYRVHVCARKADGTVRCRGSNLYGQLAKPATIESPAVTIAGVTGATSLAARNTSTVAVVAGGKLRCWGSPCGNSVVDVAGVSGVVDVSYAVSSSCAVFGDDVIRCWGTNDNGQLGDGTKTDHAAPAPIAW